MSATTAAATDTTPPAVPSGLAAVGGTGQVSLTWSANAESDLAGYDLYRDGVKVNVTPITATSFTDTGRAAGTTYTYRLAAVDTHGNASAQSAPVSATTAAGTDTTPPAVPCGLAAVGGTGQVSLTWSANAESDLAGYDLYRDGVKVNATPITATSFTDTGRAAATTYTYRLAALDTNGNASAQSAPVSATTAAAPPAPSNFDGTFEGGTDGASLAPAWAISGAPQRAEYDSARAKTGTMSGWIQGPSAAAYAGVYETATAGMTANGAEQRFWVYLDSANQPRQLDDMGSGEARALTFGFDAAGNIRVFVNTKSVTGYTADNWTVVGKYASRLDRVPHPLHLHRPRRADLHAVQARRRHRALDAAEGYRRCRLRHPVPRREQHHHHQRPAHPRLPKRQPVDRRGPLRHRAVHRDAVCRHRRLHLACRGTNGGLWRQHRHVHHHAAVRLPA